MREKKIITKNRFKTTPLRSYIMTTIKAKDTVAEVRLRKALWKLGYRYTLKNQHLPGKPDIILPKYNLIVFVDGDFWHGYRWEWRKPKLKSNRKYWVKKIENNITRDKLNTMLLKKQGWKVLRFWEHTIKENLEKCIMKLHKSINTN